MNLLLRFALIAIAIVSIPLSAYAQSIWGDRTRPNVALWGRAHLGMSPLEIRRLYPSAVAPADRTVRPGAADELLRMSFMAMGDLPATVHFLFKSERLYSVVWRISPRGDLTTLAPLYEELLRGLKAEHPVSGAVKSERQPHKPRLVSDEWVTAEGAEIGLLMFDGIEPGVARIAASAGGGRAWLRLEAYDRGLQVQEKLTEELDAIKSRKRAEAKAYNQFLEGWVGKDVSQLASKWGAPTGTTRLPNGEDIFVWDVRSGDWQCRTSLFTKANGIITKWQWSGNNCRAADER